MDRLVGHIVQVTGRVGVQEVDGGRQNALIQGLQTGQGLNGAGGTQHVAGHGLGGAHVGLLGLLLSQGQLHHLGLQGIVHGGPGAVGVDVHPLSGLVASLLQGQLNGPGAGAAVGTGRGDVEGVTGGAVAAHLAVDLSAPLHCVLILLQHQGSAPFPDDEAPSSLIEGKAGRVGVLRGGQSLHIDKAGHAALRNGRLRTAGDHRVGIAVADGPHGLTDGIGAGGAGGHRGHRRPPAVKANGDHSRGHVGNEHGDKVGGDPLGAPGQELIVLLGKGANAADAGAEVHRHPLGGQGADDAALLHRLAGRRHPVLGKGVAAQHLGFVHIGPGVKVLHLGRDLGLVVCGIKKSDGADAVDAGLQAVPARLHRVAHGADDPQAGYHHSAHGILHWYWSSV